MVLNFKIISLVNPFLLGHENVFLQPIYGFASGDPLRFKRAVGHKDLFYIDDKDVEFKDVSTLYSLFFNLFQYFAGSLF